MALTEDFDAWLQTDEHAVSATYDGSTTVTVVFDKLYFVAEAGGVEIASNEPVAQGKESDFSSPIGKTLLIGSTTYIITATEPDGTGWVMLRLREQ